MNDPLKTATAVVGLLTGVAAAVYLLGGAVIALRMLFDHFALNSAVTIIGQLPREVVITTALLDVLGPAAIVGLIAALFYGAFDRPRVRPLENDDLDEGPHWKRLLVLLALISLGLTIPALHQAWRTDGFSWLLLTSVPAMLLTYAVILAGWYQTRRLGRTDWVLQRGGARVDAFASAASPRLAARDPQHRGSAPLASLNRCPGSRRVRPRRREQPHK